MRSNSIAGNAAARALAVGPFAERLFREGHRPDRVGRDPLHWAREFDRRDDREIVAFVAAGLAYGAVAQIDRSLADLFRRVGPSPARFARDFVPGKSDRALAGFRHRFNGERDLAATFFALGRMLREHGSVEAFWAAANPAPPSPPGETIAVRAGRFVAAALALELPPYWPNGISADPGLDGRPPSVRYLWPDAAGPSACKRLNLFLRWVVRPDDGIDLGLWTVERPADLEFPVDTHVHRIATYLGATRRRTADARTRREITEFFRRVDPADPVRFDFALCRIGILRECPRAENVAACASCALESVCLRRAAMRSGRRTRRAP